LDEIRESYRLELSAFLAKPANQYVLAGGQTLRQAVGPAPSAYYLYSYNNYPLLWFSNNDAATYQTYRRFFDRLEIEDELKEMVDCQERIIMYCGFLVVGDRAPEYLWHDDYFSGANAYTLIAPLFELAPGHGHLLYAVDERREAQYHYRLGQAIVLGEKFLHTTEPYAKNDSLRVLVSMTFGTDKLDYWKRLENSLKGQSRYYLLPCGHVTGTCNCLLKHRYRKLLSFFKRG
ncbi:MAG TPA: hypothetical protein V6D23_03145, partial [Candidatus Obscuribacterales bacterium]